MDMKINNLTDQGTDYRGKIRGIAYDAVTGEFSGESVWRSKGTFQKATVNAATLPALAVKAIEVIVPAP